MYTTRNMWLMGTVNCLFFLLGFITETSLSFDSHLRGPSFVMEPPSRLEFSNSSGGWLDCSAAGSPQPSVDWLSADGTSVGAVAGVRRVLGNGTLVLLPFAAAAYRQDIHTTVYRCVASNAVGRIISRDVQVRAVVLQAFQVDVEVLGAARGCTAILRCIVPSFVKELIRVTSWVQDPSFYIYPSLQGDGKFHQLPTGELLIHNLEFNDQFPTYRCRIFHKLSRQTVISSAANIRITEHRGLVSPVIVHHTSNVQVAQDEGAAMLCVAQGCPTPDYRWYSHTQSGNMEPVLLLGGPRTRQLGPVLAIEAVTVADGGVYRCTASNAGGESSAEMRLSVTANVHVEVQPPLLSIHMGGSAEFRCVVTAAGNQPLLLTWYKDGRQLPSAGRGASETLVVSNVGREDRGMYQCVVRRAEGDTAQASAELQLGDAPPVLLYSFIEQTLQPGPAVSLKCSATGNPTPQIAWTLDGFPLPSNGRFVIGQYVTVHGDVISHVNISQVMVEDGGEYTCTAENRAGRTSHSARLNIYGMPYIRLIPKVTAVAGETLQMKCPVAGFPIEEVHWERGGRELPDDLRQKKLPDGTLLIKPVQKKDDSGVYTCWARNKQGQSARRSGEVTVIVPPKVSPFYVEDTLHVGDRASLTCSVTKGDLPLTMSWQKDGRGVESAQQLSVTQVDQFTSILLIESLAPEHNGNYTCLVRNLAAQVAHTHHLLVNVPPVIEPFTFQEGLSEGMRTRTVCGVSSGDPPLTVSWLKDGQPLTPALAVNVSALDPYSSLLSISSLSQQHTGDFTCVASNPAAEVRYTAKLQVKVPPRWLIEPFDISVERNRHVALHCQAQGVPIPSIVWKKAIGSKTGDYEEVRERLHIKLLGNGTLLLQNVKEDREGFYLCKANNGIGTGIGKVVHLSVNSSPQFSAPSRLVTVKKGDVATLHCDVNGDKPLNVIWLRGSGAASSVNNKQQLDPLTNYRIHAKQDVTPDGVAAEMQITNVAASDSGAYFCQAKNLYGTEHQLVQLVVQEPPLSPHHLEASIITSRSVHLQWQHPSSSTQSATSTDTNQLYKFIVEYQQTDRLPWQQIEISDMPLQYTAIIEDLKPATRYTFRVVAEGPAGRSLPSAELSVRTEPQRPAGPPLNVAARAIASTELLVTWTPPLSELQHGDIYGFNIGYKSLSSTSANTNTNLASTTNYNFTSVTGDGQDGSGELLLTDLAKYTRYMIVVQAFNEVGPGPLSEPIHIQTLEDDNVMFLDIRMPEDVNDKCVAMYIFGLFTQTTVVPTMAPEDVRCAALTSQSLQVSWQPPPTSHCNGLLQGYKFTYEPMIDDMFSLNVGDEMETRKTTALTSVITGLRKYTNYSIQVLAFTRIGDGVFTTPIFCRTDEDVPGAPSDIKVVVSSSQSLIVSWLPPLEPNGVLTKYNLYKRSMEGRQEIEHAKQSVPNQHTSYEAKGLQSHVEYQFWVTAATKIGEGQSSRVVTQVATSRVQARIISFGEHIVRPWRSSVTLACVSVGQPRREWQRGDVIFKDSLSNHNIQMLDTGELLLSNLQLADSGNYTCQVDNGQGSDLIVHQLLVQVPPAAPVLYVTSATSSSILLHWKATNTGGAPITGYILNFRRMHGDLDEMPLSRHFTSHELKGLLCGTAYSLYLIAQNKIGSSAASPSLLVRTQGQPPGVPSAANFLSPNSTSLVLRLHIWPDNGCPLLYFILQYRKTSDAQWTLVSNTLKPQRRFLITGLTAATKYVIKLEAFNVAGSSTAEFAFMTLTKDGNVPLPILIKQGDSSNTVPFYSDIRIMVPLVIVIFAVLAIGVLGFICLKKRENDERKEALDNQQNAEAARERYYATIHKVSLQPGTGPEKIPETSEDISPYATFQLSEPSTLPSKNTMLHSFMYHEHAMTEGCASPPPVQRNNSPYYNVSTKGRRRRKTDMDSDDSESDPEQLTSSRTESSNQLDMKLKHNFIYHGAQSSTSSDISPMSEQKSLPRRGRSSGSKWLAASRASMRTLLPPLSVAETTFGPTSTVPNDHLNTPTPDRPELSEAECDIDTLKKLKLGLRSSLWSRPAANTATQQQQQHPHSDYSIAV